MKKRITITKQTKEEKKMKMSAMEIVIAVARKFHCGLEWDHNINDPLYYCAKCKKNYCGHQVIARKSKMVNGKMVSKNYNPPICQNCNNPVRNKLDPKHDKYFKEEKHERKN